jgi:hypothetical protein
MPHYIIFEKTTGIILQTGNAPIDAIESMSESNEVDYILDVAVFDAAQYVDTTTNTIQSIPDAPNPCSDFDWVSKQWVSNLEKAKALVRKNIEAKREAVLQEPIVYGDKLLDADSRAVMNILNKYTELSARASIGQNPNQADLVWRDKNNTIHQWANLTLYRRFIEGFSIAIAQRGTNAYKRSWALKDTVDSLTEFDAVLNLDIQSGWDAG